MEHTELLLRLGASLAIGFLIGLQREFALGGSEREIVAGERTYALFGLAGALAAMASDEFDSSLPLVGILLVLGTFASIAYYYDTSRGKIGLTTEVSMLVAIMIGALCYWGYLTLAVAIGVATTLVLSIKLETDRLVQALTREDIFATLQFAIISAIVLPVLPNQSFLPPPFDVLNPFKLWLMVVFISGMSFLGYIAIKVVGARQGIGISGFLGGLVSSTAVTLSFSDQSREEPELAKPFAFGITLAWTVMFIRVLVEVGVVYRPMLEKLWLPIFASGLIGVIFVFFQYYSRRNVDKRDVEFTNPFNLWSAMKFGLLYAVVLLISRTAQLYFGDLGIFVSSLLTGLADVDAITLSVAELGRNGAISMETGTQAIVIAAMSNTAVKGIIAMISGSKELRKTVFPILILMLVTGIGVAFLV